MTDLSAADLDTILTALTERRNRLIQLDINGGVHPNAEDRLRSRITECNLAIRKVKAVMNADLS